MSNFHTFINRIIGELISIVDKAYFSSIMQIEILHSKGEEVFGSRENFSTWLETENLALGNIIPRDLLKNSFGINLLMDELVRIEHGVLA